MEQLASQLHLYLHYVHHIDITLVDGNKVLAHIINTRMVSQKEEKKGQANEGKKHIIILD